MSSHILPISPPEVGHECGVCGDIGIVRVGDTQAFFCAGENCFLSWNYRGEASGPWNLIEKPEWTANIFAVLLDRGLRADKIPDRDQIVIGIAEDWLSHTAYGWFLMTRYWEFIRDWTRARFSGECVLCRSEVELHVHHNTYTHRGSEWRYPEDLVLLCAACHHKHHGTKTVNSLGRERARSLSQRPASELT